MTGKGCLWIVAIFVVLIFLIGSCISHYSGSDDCYTTGDPGSAQESRDIQHCIKQDR